MITINKKRVNRVRNEFGWNRYHKALADGDYIIGWNPPGFSGKRGQVVSGFSFFDSNTIPPTEYIWLWEDLRNGGTWTLINKYIYTDTDNVHIMTGNIIWTGLVIGGCVISLWMILTFIIMVFDIYR